MMNINELSAYLKSPLVIGNVKLQAHFNISVLERGEELGMSNWVNAGPKRTEGLESYIAHATHHLSYEEAGMDMLKLAFDGINDRLWVEHIKKAGPFDAILHWPDGSEMLIDVKCIAHDSETITIQESEYKAIRRPEPLTIILAIFIKHLDGYIVFDRLISSNRQMWAGSHRNDSFFVYRDNLKLG